MQFMTVMKSHGGSWAVAKMKKNEMSSWTNLIESFDDDDDDGNSSCTLLFVLHSIQLFPSF
jgi:hypothetical protein